MNTRKRFSIVEQLMGHAKRQGTSLALQHGQTCMSFTDLASKATAVALIFEQQCNNEQSISLCITDPVKFLIAFLGARLCGHNVLVLNPAWPMQMRAQCISQLSPAFSLDDSSVTPFIENGLLHHQGNIEKAKFKDCDLNAPFYTGFTSGSEGSPKGFTRHENSWLQSFESDEDCYKLCQDDSVVCPGSLAHSLFLYASLRALYAGLPVVFLDGLSQRQQRRQLSSIPNAVLFAVPAQLQALVESKAEYRNLRLAISAGAKLSPALREELHHTLPAVKLFECYGSSELSYIALSKPADHPPPNSVGKPCIGVEIKVTNHAYQPLVSGQSGRILVRSPMCFMGYAQANNTASRRNVKEIEGFVDSGDSGYLDNEGFLYITGRSDRMMLIAGHNVFPEQVETALSAFEKIRQIVVFPAQDKLRGQRPVAVIQVAAETTLTRNEVMTFAKTRLPDHAIPRHYYCTRGWPSTVSDKADIQKIQELYQKQQLERLP